MSSTTSERKPRAYFTKKLEKFLGDLALNSTRCHEFNGAWRGKQAEYFWSQTTVEEVWVYGSYARGASECGDLDLIVRLSFAGVDGKPSRAPSNRQAVMAFWRAQRDLQINVGTPQKNSANVAVADAILVWKPGMDWRTAIAAIKVSHSAGRFHRITDLLPVDFHRVGMGIDVAQQYGHAIDAGLVRMTWIPFSETLVTPENMRADERKVSRATEHRRGKEAQIALAHVIATARSLATDLDQSNRGWALAYPELQWAGFDVELGNHHGHPLAFAETSRRGYIVAPYLRKKSNINGLLLIERGDEARKSMVDFKIAMRERDREGRLAESQAAPQ